MPATTSSRHRQLRALLLLAALALAACGADDGADGASERGNPAGSDAQVVIEGFSFDPVAVEVASGTTVTWTNQDSAPHTVEDGSALFPESDELTQGDTFSFTYDTPGEYPYVCGIHPYMKGTVAVS